MALSGGKCLGWHDQNGDHHYTNNRPIGAGRNTGLGEIQLGFRLDF